MSFHHVISTSDRFTLIVGATVSFLSIGLTGVSGPSSPPPHAVSSPAAVHREIVLIALEAVGAIAVIVFTLAGKTVDVVVVAIGAIVLAAIHVLIRVSLTAFFVLFTKFEYLLGCLVDSWKFMLFGFVIAL